MASVKNVQDVQSAARGFFSPKAAAIMCRAWVRISGGAEIRTRGVLEGGSKLEHMAYEIPVTQARAELADLINKVVYGGERVVVTRHGKPLVALVSAADLERLDKLDAAEEQVISAVSSVREVAAASVERQRFGIAAEHQRPGAR
ncbi:prevent-host-death family protein [Streptomyces turgidiscabies]|uniref:Antitoxin n=2 Tax=Streptomyces turgidiscabies TaxID=85558 RepID=A0ABU0RXM4_9ACTN|nr:prevent-host-death family protein [Streptomyces turgidiscabies]